MNGRNIKPAGSFPQNQKGWEDYKRQGIDWTKKDMYEGLGRPDLRPECDKMSKVIYALEHVVDELKELIYKVDEMNRGGGNG